MPITPKFSLTQTDSHVHLEISVPHVRVTPDSVQVVVTEDSILHFASAPYLLVLEFSPCRFHETAAESCATYEPTIQNGVIRLELKKEAKEHWDNLDLLGKLVRTRAQVGTTRWLQEVQTETAGALEGEDFVIEAQPAPGSPMDFAGYGFLRMFHGIFADLARDGLAKEMLEMPWEEQGLSLSESSVRLERQEQRLQVEHETFSSERYTGDLEIEDDYIYQCAMAMKPHWQGAPSDGNVSDLTQQMCSLGIQKGSQGNQEAFFTSEERLQLMAIPYPLLPPSIQPDQDDALCLGLLDLLFAYAHDHVGTDGDSTVESAWNITILSASLSWLEDWFSTGSTVQSVIQSSLRRAIIYPYIRNHEFGIHMWKHVATILRQGVRCVLRCLLQTRTILERSEMYYLGNKLFLDPYLAWMQARAGTLSEKLASLAMKVETVLLDTTLKAGLGLDLVQIETTAAEVQDGEEESGSEEDESDDSDDDGDSSEDDQDSIDSIDKTEPLKAAKTDAVVSEVGDAPRSSELLDSNLGKSVLLAVASSPSIGIDSSDTGPAGVPPVKKPLIEEME